MKKYICMLTMVICLAAAGCAANKDEKELLKTAPKAVETTAAPAAETEAPETAAAGTVVETEAAAGSTGSVATEMGSGETAAADAGNGETAEAGGTAAEELFTLEGETTAAGTNTENPVEAGLIAEITVKDYGTIRVALDADAAPISVENFVTLARDGFYDGLTFHRIIDGFMIQGGDPSGTGYGGSDKPIQGEFAMNGIDNPISHTRGTISMARTQDYNSATSQFFIMQADGTYLDGQYAGFGTVLEGMEIVDKICKDTPVEDSNGTVDAKNQPVIESIRIVEPEQEAGE